MRQVWIIMKFSTAKSGTTFSALAGAGSNQ
jgi:hypothetical protein